MSVVFDQLAMGPNDAEYWQYSGDDAHEYLTVLDGVGDLMVRGTTNEHLSTSLLGAEAVRQWEAHFSPDPSAIPAFAGLIRELGMVEFANAAETCVTQLKEFPTEPCTFEKRQNIVDQLIDNPKIFGFDRERAKTELVADIAHQLALWVESNIPRFKTSSNQEFQNFYKSRWLRVRDKHPEIWRQRMAENIGSVSVNLLVQAGMDRNYWRRLRTKELSNPAQEPLILTPFVSDAGTELAVIRFSDAAVLVDLLDWSEITRKAVEYDQSMRTGPKLWSIKDKPRFALSLSDPKNKTIVRSKLYRRVKPLIYKH